MEGPNLKEYFYEKKEGGSKVQVSEMMCIILQLAQAFEYLKYFHIVHRDVKADNILLSGRMLKYEINGTTVTAP